MRVVDVFDFVRERGGMLLADCFAVALRELGCVRQRRRVCGVECAELALRGLAVGECGGVFPLLAAMGRVDDRNGDRREQPCDGEQRHDDGEHCVAAVVWGRCGGRRFFTGESGVEKIKIVVVLFVGVFGRIVSHVAPYPVMTFHYWISIVRPLSTG